MKTSMRSLLVAVAFVSAVGAGTLVQAQAADTNVVLLSANQPYMSQRAMKAYAQLGANVAPEQAGTILRQAMADLQSNFGDLKQVAPATVAPQLDQQRKLMDQFAAVLAQPPTPANLTAALKVSEDLLALAESTTKTLSANSTQSAMLVMAARQRMLSQRVAAAFFLEQTPLKSPDMRHRMETSQKEFHNLVSTFEDHKGDIPGTENAVELARMQMVFLDNALNGVDSATPRQMSTVATANERVLSQMIELTKAIQKHVDDATPRPAKK